MRRITTGLLTFLVMTATLLVLPVYAAPGPTAEPVAPSIEDVALGSVLDPADDAVVVSDGQARPEGVDEDEITASPSTAPEPPPTTGPAPADPTAGESDPAEAGSAESDPAESDGSGAAGGAEEPASETTAAGPTATGGPEDGGVVTSGEEVPGVPALTISRPDTDRFASVGVTWLQEDLRDVVVQIRVADATGTWGDWSTLEADDIEQTTTKSTTGDEIRGGTAPYWTGDAYGIEVIVQGEGGAVPRDVQLTLVDPGTSDADALPETPAVVGEAHAGTTLPVVVSRAQWGADESIRSWDPEYAPTLKAATLHHTADSNNYAATDVARMLRSIYAYHAVSRGWGDIGYNYIVDKFGRVFEGRYGGSTVVGAHAGGFNTGTLGVSMLGDYTSVEPPPVMLESVAAIMAWKLSLYGVNPYGTTQLTSGGGGTARYGAGTVVTLPTIFAHRDVGTTTCPGQAAYNRMAQLRDMVAARYTPIAGSPTGNLEVFSMMGNLLQVSGWTYDPDVPTESTSIAISVDGAWAVNAVADKSRPDVAGVHPHAGAAHGFTTELQLAAGRRDVCVVFVNGGASGANTWMRCQRLDVPSAPDFSPIGNVESVRAQGLTLSAAGWTYDPDMPRSPLQVHVYVNGVFQTAVTADQHRSDIDAAFAGVGPDHGWSWQHRVSQPGAYRVCVYAINQGRGAGNPQLNCITAVVAAAAFDPVGRVEAGGIIGRGAELSGWALDPARESGSTQVQFTVDGRATWTIPADLERPDVGAVFPGSGDQHGFSTAWNLAPGPHSVCAYALGVGARSPMVGCVSGTVTDRAWEPVGHLDGVAVVGTGRVDVSGWVWDPDAGPSSSQVHLYVDGRYTGSYRAADGRPDLTAVLPPQAGDGHGFTETLSIGTGQHTVCAVAPNVGMGRTAQALGCLTVTA